MRAGTQTLIQALQALPWMMNDDEDGAVSDAAQSEESDDERPSCEWQIHREFRPGSHAYFSTVKRLSSSIHAIYRPLARSHRLNSAAPKHEGNSSPVAEEDTVSEDTSLSEDELTQDFNDTPRPSHLRPQHVRRRSPGENSEETGTVGRESPSTLRVHRRTRLAEKLREIFELEGIQEVWAGTPLYITLIPRSCSLSLQKCPVGCYDPSVGSLFFVGYHSLIILQCSKVTCTSQTIICASSRTCRRERYVRPSSRIPWPLT